MTPEKQEELVNKYPKIFSIVKHFECADGWYAIIDCLCANIESISKNKMYKMTDDEKTDNQVIAVQVKEKFGGLRFYIDHTDFDEIYGVISMAESISHRTCENCGNKGHKQPGSYWVRTLCDSCQMAHTTRALT